jgi:hypothetical protein
MVRVSVGRFARFYWAFDANGNGQSVLMTVEFAGNSLEGQLMATVFSGGCALVR